MLKKVPTPQDVIKYIDEVNSRIGDTTALVYSDFVEVREDNMREEGETEEDMRIFITGLDVKKFNKTPNLGDTFITVLYIGSIDDGEKIMVQPVVHEIAEDGSVTIEIIQNAMVLLPRGERGENGTSAGFGTPHASATALSPDSDPTVEVTASGGDYAKVFDFTFGIPVGAKILTYNETIKGVNELDTALLEISKFNHTPQMNELFACIFDAGEHGIFYQTRKITQTQTSAVIASVVSSNVIPAGSIDWAAINGISATPAADRNGIAIGYGATAFGENSVAIGQSVQVGGSFPVHYANNSIAIGVYPTGTGGESAIAIGHNAQSGDYNDIAIGTDIWAPYGQSIAIGSNINSNYADIYIGSNIGTYFHSNNTIAIGRDLDCRYMNGSIVIGNDISIASQADNIIAIGSNINGKGGVTSRNSIMIGVNANSYSDAIAIGTNAEASGGGTIAIGANTQSYYNSIAIGPCAAAINKQGGSDFIGDASIAIGYNANIAGKYAIAIGYNAHIYSNSTNVIAFGRGATVPDGMNNAIYLGDANLKSITAAVTTITKLSDERTKEDIELANTAQCLVDVNRLPVKRFKYKKFARFDPKDVHVTEFIAQDAQKVFPKSILTYDEEFPELDVNGEPILIDEVDDNGQIVYEDDGVTPRKVEKKFVLKDVLHMDTSFAIPTLWAAVQELTKRVQQLEYLLR